MGGPHVWDCRGFPAPVSSTTTQDGQQLEQIPMLARLVILFMGQHDRVALLHIGAS